MNACITRETFVLNYSFLRVFHSTLKLELCRHACRRRDPIISTCRYGKDMPTTALLATTSKYQNLKVKWKEGTVTVLEHLRAKTQDCTYRKNIFKENRICSPFITMRPHILPLNEKKGSAFSLYSHDI